MNTGKFEHEIPGGLHSSFGWMQEPNGTVVFTVTYAGQGSAIKLTAEEVATLIAELDPGAHVIIEAAATLLDAEADRLAQAPEGPDPIIIATYREAATIVRKGRNR